ncbi:hypothetical protein E4U61_001716 [Claviceps capensis]|nr:hypothetical protein E4U61_001716 [Claviceps capensis]
MDRMAVKLDNLENVLIQGDKRVPVVTRETMVHDDDGAGEAADDTSGAQKPDVRMTRQEHYRPTKKSSTSSFTAVPPFTSSENPPTLPWTPRYQQSRSVIWIE